MDYLRKAYGEWKENEVCASFLSPDLPLYNSQSQ